MNSEKLSQLLDGELDGQEMEDALDALLADSALQQSWHSIHCMRAAVHETDVPVINNIQHKVSAALALEPDIVAPNNIDLERLTDQNPGDQTPAQSDRVVPIEPKRSNVIKYIALAASVAALTMVFYAPNETSGPTIAQSGSSPVMQSGIEQEMQSMIVQHGEFSGVAALNGLVAYAKVVNDSAVDRRTQ